MAQQEHAGAARPFAENAIDRRISKLHALLGASHRFRIGS
jgi:hypothetical protein